MGFVEQGGGVLQSVGEWCLIEAADPDEHRKIRADHGEGDGWNLALNLQAIISHSLTTASMEDRR
jgi:hypothetical protein